jgi:nuclear pore complex protein Nup188
MEVNPKIPKMKQLLKEVWETIHSLGSSFEIALASGDASYYRILLKLLFLGLRVHSDGNTFEQADQKPSKRMEESTTTVRLVVDILERVVAQGFRDLAVVVHDNHEQSSPEDIALITGILQACLRVPGIEFCHPQIVTMMANCGTPRIATTLFSWADRIAINGDPIFGELAIIFLLELSSMPAMAEQLAIDGILGHLSSAAITTYLRRNNVSPFADSAGVQRCYNIWVRGILPLLLNLLHSVGASIATEVALFLNQFPHLLAQSAAAFDAPEHSRTTLPRQMKYISLAVCSEVHSLALIVYILNGFREQLQGIQEVPDVKWDLGAVGENVEFWLGSRVLLRERIVPMGERDVEWKGRKLDQKAEGKGLGCADRLEEKCVLEMIGVRDVVNGGDP